MNSTGKWGQYRQITFHAGLVQCRSGHLPTFLAAMIPLAGPNTGDGVPLLYLAVKDVESRTPVGGLSLGYKKGSCSRGAVDYDSCCVAELQLEHIAILLRPFAILISGYLVPEVR